MSGNADEAIALVRESLTWIRDLQTSTRSHTRWSLLLPPRYSRATTSGRRGSWARGTPSASARAPRSSSNWCTTSRCSRNGRFVHALARIGGRLRTPPGAGRRIGLRRLFQIQSRVADVAKPAAYVLLQASLKQPADGRRRFEWQVPGIVPPLVIVGSCCSSREGRTRSRTNACPPVR